ncbi:GNAT family N-acetyltransferase [Paracoccus seriniphilus]|uniref:Putative acetyltransferase n=1 Tax=Paracoccus seriniphilus TaxID=184748 RepID=A0A239PMV9_9RHOB|nr:GNAT family N-acetyltransferase [Paracoccus seriniphilus]WCR14931.1 GNAT family N-acetyltransferase [Paracoccus seriniphilus]SNT71645.1 putative acetyltransferase [Paracoccus seriniphilus]
MSCACGHHAPTMNHDCDDHGTPVALRAPLLALNGKITCAETAQMLTALSLLPDHMALSRQEPGCLRFDIWQDEDPMVWNITELFTDQQAFAAHQSRTADSEWGRNSTEMQRDFTSKEVFPVIRPELASDHDGIVRLHEAAFGRGDEAALVQTLRSDGDLALSRVAVAAGQIIGHVALSPVEAPRPAYALAPVAVTPKLQSRGIGAALITAALEWAGPATVVVLGDPEYYPRFGFVPADLDSPYAGPHLMIRGELPAGVTIRHAPAFSGL